MGGARSESKTSLPPGNGKEMGKGRKQLSLSQYMHGKFVTVLDHSKSTEEKINVVKRFRDFLDLNIAPLPSVSFSAEVEKNDEDKTSIESHMPLASDQYISFQSIESNIVNRNKRNTIQDGIQLPSINWQSHFRKGYSLLMWIRINAFDKNMDNVESTAGGFEPKILYRFATSGDKSACGIQASLHAPKSALEVPPDSNCIYTALRIESLSPKSFKNSNALSSSRALIMLLPLPVDKWTLLGIQHYLPGILQNKKPVLSVHLDGDEVFRGELNLPTLGADVGEVMTDNYLLCNITDNRKTFHSGGLGIERLDLAGVGLFKDVIPGYMQGIVSEHGPSTSSDGVVPIIPPVAQCRDAVITSGDGRTKTNKKNTFGLKSTSRSGNGVIGRGVGVPLSKGLLLNSDGNVTGDVHLQKFLSKLVLGLNSSNALVIGDKRVVIKINAGCTVGLTGEVPKVGVCQPNLPLNHSSPSVVSPFEDNRTGNDDSIPGAFFANCKGNVTLHHTTNEFLKVERHHASDGTLPHYELPSSMQEIQPMPSFLLTYISMNPLSYILQPFHLALPPPGFAHSLQIKYYRESFDHLNTLIVYRDGTLAAQLIKLLATSLTMGGEIREQILQSGGLHTFANLLRRTILRASRLGMLTGNRTTDIKKNQNKEELWQFYAVKESPYDDTDDEVHHKHSSPPYIPPLITEACCSVIRACCGPILNKENKDCIAHHIRRISDLALTAVFGLAFDLDLWGDDRVAVAAILREVVVRYCWVEEHTDCHLNSIRKHDNGYGWLLRGQMTVQFLLDTIRLRFNSEKFESSTMNLKSPQKIKDGKTLKCIASSFSSILYIMLKYSLSSNRSTSRGENDIIATVAALSDCPLGSIGAQVVLTALRDILVYCEIINNGTETIEEPKNISSLLQSTSSPPLSPTLKNVKYKKAPSSEDEESLKLIRIKSDIAARLGKNLLMAQFHDVIGPMLLSRTVFDWRRAMMENSAAQMKNKTKTIKKTSQIRALIFESSATEESTITWQHHWRLSLMLFTWLASISGPEGEIAAKSTGSLLFHSGVAGSLSGCLLGRSKYENSFFNALLAPSPSSLYENRVTHTNDASHRFRIVMHMLGGLVASLVSKTSQNNQITGKGDEVILMTPEAVDSLSALTSAVITTLRCIHNKGNNLNSFNNDSRRQRRVISGNSISNKMAIKAAKEAVPPLLIAAALLNEPIQQFKGACAIDKETERPNSLVNVYVSEPFAEAFPSNKDSHSNRPRTDSDLSWVDVIPSKIDFSDISSQPLISLEEQLHALKTCEQMLLNSAGILILNAMTVGGGEASTLVWRVVVSALASFRPNLEQKTKVKNTNKNSEEIIKNQKVDDKDNTTKDISHSDDSLDRKLLCRLTAMVLNFIMSKHRNVDGDALENIELCSATARLCDLVEEKNLLQVPLSYPTKSSSNTLPRFSPVQVHLLCACLDVMESGRNQTGWCQVLPVLRDGFGHTIMKERGSKVLDSELLLNEKKSLLDLKSVGEEFHGLLPHNEIYHQQLESQLNDSFQPMPLDDIQAHRDHPNRLRSRPVPSSKRLLPILQPILRIILSCLGQIRSKARVIISHQSQAGVRKSLLSKIIEELHNTLTAAIVGLTFSNARDTCLNSLSFLRKAIDHHKEVKDIPAVNMCNALIVSVIKEMRVRYVEEREKRETEQLRAYDEGKNESQIKSTPLSFLIGHEAENKIRKTEGENEMTNANEVENLLLGNSLIDKSTQHILHEMGDEEVNFSDGTMTIESRERTAVSETDDFILFAEHSNEIIQDTVGSSMGWNNFRGFGAALEKCHKALQNDRANYTKTRVELEEDQNNSVVTLKILSTYIDTWDAKQTQDAVESELVDLFGDNTSVSDVPFQQDSTPIGLSSVVFGSETAADSMSSYIELASSENARIADIQHSILPTRRNDRMAFAERYTWKCFMDFFGSRQRYGEDFFERCMSDGGRDYGARLVSTPIHPQFARYIPPQLDHSISSSNLRSETIQADESSLKVKAQDITVDMGEIKTLVERGDLKIVDVTKKKEEDVSIEEDDIDGSENVLVSKPSMGMSDELEEEAKEEGEDDIKTSIEDSYLEFPEKGEEADDPCDKIDYTERAHEEITPHLSMNYKGNISEGNKNSRNFVPSSFADPPNGTMSCLVSRYSHLSGSLGFSAGGGHGFIELSFGNCLQIKAQGSRKGTLFLTPTFLIFEYTSSTGLLEGESLAIEEKKKRVADDIFPDANINADTRNLGKNCKLFEQQQKKTAALRPKALRWNISELSHIYLRRYRLRDSALELFFLPSGGSAAGGNTLLSALSSVFLDFGSGREGNERRDDVANSIMKRAPTQTVKQWPEKSSQVLHDQLRNVIKGWMTGRISNFDYLLSINCLAGRSFNDLCQYPVFPWVLSNYTSNEVPDLNDRSNYRDLTKPMGALNTDRLEEFIDRFQTFQDAVIPPFMYGSHYSTSAGVVLHFLVRMHPFASLHRQLQGDHFDVADRIFSSVSRTWDMCTGVCAAEVKELTPEWYCNPSFLRNANNLKLGTSQDGELLGDVILPPWAKGSPEKFVEVLRCALESDICSAMLPHWIDLIFGMKQQGRAAVEAHNVFFYLTYYGSVDVASLEDDDLRVATELQIAHFGQCPMQLFRRPHVQKLPRGSLQRRPSLSEMLKLYDLTEIMSLQNADSRSIVNKKDVTSDQPFQSAPLSHWVHLFAPPPGPHAPLVAVRLAGADRCVAIDAQGIIHCFRWAWKADSDTIANESTSDKEVLDIRNSSDLFIDEGCFVTQRELPHFLSIPRLRYSPPNNDDHKWSSQESCAVVSISKSLFASRTLLLVLSDGDGRGSLCVELVDPVKGLVKGEVLVPFIHSSRITAIHMDAMGIASGVGGVGGELAIVGSADGTATLWRFISSQFLPLRPRLRLYGHSGSRINAVVVDSGLNVCITVSDCLCCLFSLGNGVMLHSISPPSSKTAGLPETDEDQLDIRTIFAETNAVCIASGHIVLVCKSLFVSKSGDSLREVVTLQLYTLEGVHLGSKALESWRGTPHKICSTFDGRAVMVCSRRGISIHVVSALMPLHFVDEWQITDDNGVKDSIVQVYDVDFGPSPSRPVVVVASCSSGALRLHALKGISEWSEENKKGSMTEVVGNALAKPAQKFRTLVGSVKGTGSRVVGYGKEIGREAITDVKTKGMSGFFGDVFGKK